MMVGIDWILHVFEDFSQNIFLISRFYARANSMTHDYINMYIEYIKCIILYIFHTYLCICNNVIMKLTCVINR